MLFMIIQGMIVKYIIYSLYLCKTKRNAIVMTVMVSCKNQNSRYQLIRGPVTVPPPNER